MSGTTADLTGSSISQGLRPRDGSLPFVRGTRCVVSDWQLDKLRRPDDMASVRDSYCLNVLGCYSLLIMHKREADGGNI